MSDIVIKVENLGKRFRIGETASYKTLRESLTNAFTAPFRRRSPVKNQSTDANRKTHHIWALKDVSFQVERGQVVGIIGKNGSGKSTLLKTLSRIVSPTEGHAEIRGNVSSLLEVGTGFHPELTGRENINLNAAILGMKRVDVKRKFDAIIDFAGDTVKEFIDTPVKRYSSGMYMRLAFSVAAHLDTDVLLVDEVLAVGDAEFQAKCLGKMGDIARGGRTVLFVSHNMFNLQNLCTRGILLENGKVTMNGTISDVITKYLNLQNIKAGEIKWDSPDNALGDQRLRLKAVRVLSKEKVTGEVDISKEIRIEIDYWILEPDKRRNVGIHIYNSMGICVLISANWPSATTTPDPWYDLPYPRGIFRSICTLPGDFLNDGLYTISVAFAVPKTEHIVFARDVLSFMVIDTGAMRKEYTGQWLGTVRPRLDWKTGQLS